MRQQQVPSPRRKLPSKKKKLFAVRMKNTRRRNIESTVDEKGEAQGICHGIISNPQPPRHIYFA